ncbi:MAG: hypothetical protein OXI43_13920 [Candidatus Poribacteria bacterium]|nr:hypothetical protein [Candidatus Poribacteria bacterium]
MYFRLLSLSFLLITFLIGCSTQDNDVIPSGDVGNPHYVKYREALKSIQADWIRANQRIKRVYSEAFDYLPKTRAEGFNPKAHDALKAEMNKLLRANDNKRWQARRRAWFDYRDAILTESERKILSSEVNE